MSHTNRIRHLQYALKDLACDAILIEDTTSLYYLTGLHLSAGKLMVSTTQALLIVDGRYIESAKRYSPIPSMLWEEGIIKKTALEWQLATLGFCVEDTTYQRYAQLATSLQESDIKLVDVENPVRKLRVIKDADELSLLREAASLGSRGYDLVVSLLEEGITERELAHALEVFWLKEGGKKLAFDPIIAFGPNSSQPHYRAGNVKLEQGNTVLIDIGVTLNDYHSDMTRTVFYGEPSDIMRKIYGIVKQAQEAALALCRPGTAVGELDHAARDLIAQTGYGEQFSHSLGHGLGLEVHEPPTLRNKDPFKDIILQPGMVITIEPGIYIPDTGGVRIEDSIVITADGYEDLTKRSKELQVIQ